MKSLKNKSKPKRNIPVIVFALLALLCFILSFAYHWLFIVPTLILIAINYRLLFKKN